MRKAIRILAKTPTALAAFYRLRKGKKIIKPKTNLGTLVDTAPDLMRAHNHAMKKFGYPTKSTDEIRTLVGQGAGALLGRSIWGQAKKEFVKVQE